LHGEHIQGGGDQLAEVTLECLHADGLDVSSWPQHLRMVAFQPTLLPWAGTLGRQHQPGFFEKLVPNQELHMQISRSHFELTILPGADDALALKLLSRSPGITMWVDGSKVASQGFHPVALAHDSVLGFSCGADDAARCFLELQVKLRSQAEVCAEVASSSRVAPFPALCRPIGPLPRAHRSTIMMPTLQESMLPGRRHSVVGAYSVSLPSRVAGGQVVSLSAASSAVWVK
jgi:hypothetical protein